ncbi:MAG: threonine--tRNA ligase [Candidatus Babeliales bacterium]|nr:threonine--tRNA ligase [Candidatus Babeliales bacterium]
MSSKNDLKVLRHSAAHLLAQAVLELYPDTKLTIGPATSDGFFYDFAPTKNFKEEDLPKIEARMHELSDKNYPIEHEDLDKTKAREIYKDNPFKLELIEDIPGDTVGFSKQGDFYDLCRGGHVSSTGEIKYFKLLSLAGSYWRADRTRENLQRIYGTAFFTKEDLEKYELQKEEALKYDHRKLGKEMDLFSFHDEGPGFPFFHPKGKAIINVLIEYMRHLRNMSGYVEIATPVILSDELWKRSGHYGHYKENMYFTNIDDKSYAIKPMNCPGAILVYKTRPRSYRELPLRLSEFGLVHRHELSGVLHGLLRVRAFTQDDSHVFCTIDQIQQEVTKKIENTFKVLNKFGFEKVKVKLSTKPSNAMGDDALWTKAIDYLKTTLENLNVKYEIEAGDGAFYGPKIDFKIEDSMGREWQLSTIQVDFFQPINFDLHFVAPSGQQERPVMIHQAIYGSLERFFAILLEHFKGNLPFFVAPVQIRILTITDEQKEYAEQIFKTLKLQNIRVEIDESSDPISGKIKSATLDKIPWMIVIGKKEVENNTITLRFKDGNQEPNLSINDLIDRCKSQN